MGKEYTRQHIVPRSYLDRFGIPSGKTTTIGTRMNNNGKVRYFATATENVGYIKNYYDVTDKTDPKYWEHYLANTIDTLCGRPLGNIIAKITLSQDNAVVLSDQDKQILSKIIVAQMMRIPDSMRYAMDELYPRVSKEVKEEMVVQLPPELLEKYGDRIKKFEISQQQQKEFILNYTFDPKNFDRYCRILQSGIWIVYINAIRDTMPFLTSDNPVLVEGIGKKETGLFRNGLATPSTCIFYPLNPGIAIVIYSRHGIAACLADDFGNRKTKIAEINYIGQRNIKIMAQSYQHTFLPQPLFDAIRYYELTPTDDAGDAP